MKYKICKFQDANGKEWYQIKIKWWLLNYYHGDANYDNFVWDREPNKYQTEYLAKEAIRALTAQENSNKIKLVGCVEV